MKKNQGVTLIALVVTIIVLLILAVVSFRVITGDDGILNKAETSASETEIAKAKEQAELWIAEQVANYYEEGHSGTLVAYIEDELGTDGVTVGNYTITKATGGSAKVESVVKVATLEGAYATETPQTLEIEVHKGDKNGEKMAIGTVGATGKVTWEASSSGTGSGSGGGTGSESGTGGSSESGDTATLTIETSDGRWSASKGVNTPKLLPGMTGVYWDGTTETPVTDTNIDNWYDYSSTNKKWANAKTEDGSYWVWIPRYAYKITSGCNTSTAGTIEVKFLQGVTNNDSTGTTISTTYPTVTSGAMGDFVVHPAFGTDVNNGGWSTNLAGIWVAKYEMSMETGGTATTTGGPTTGNVPTSSTVKMVSKPGVTSWRYITIGNIYTNCLNYDTNLNTPREIYDSHMMKNSEWGAVAYLSRSSYGLGSTEITINDNSSFYTGGAQNATATTNVAQSTTGNSSGIFDINGGAWEYVAGYITNGNGNLSTYGSSFATETTSTPYRTVYPYNSSSDGGANNWTAYNAINATTTTRFGDGILETSTEGTGYTSWRRDYSFFPHTTGPFFIRGGKYNMGSDAGAFAFFCKSGSTYDDVSFRVVLGGK